jgi:enoyl-CoA hydratase/carnithine racemase
MGYKTLLYDVEGEIGTLTFNRPEVVNAINTEMLGELTEFWQERQEDFKVRVIIIRGAGEKGFCSGLDLKQTSNVEDGLKKGEGGFVSEAIYSGQKRFSTVARLMRSCPQPIIAAVHGAAMGGGLSFATASDVRLASDDAIFCAQYINVGLGGVDVGTSYFLWLIVGWGRAAEMSLTGMRVYADEAYRIGLINHVYPREKLMPAALDMAKNMASKTRMALRLTKDALNAGINLSSLEDAVKIEDRNQAFLFMSGLYKDQNREGS